MLLLHKARNQRPGAIFEATASDIKKATRSAMEKLFQYWHKNFAPKHFTLKAFTEYYEFYKWNYKIRKTQVIEGYDKGSNLKPVFFDKKTGQWKQLYLRRGGSRGESALPLVKTGTLRARFLFGGYTFTGSSERISVKWKGLGPPSGFEKIRNALTCVNDSEAQKLEKLFKKFISEELEKDSGPSVKSYGRASLI